MDADERDQESRDEEYVQREESRQRGARDDGSAQHQVDDPRSRDRHTARDRCADAQPPVGVLIESKHLARERHAQRDEQQQDTDNPRELTRKLVCAEEEHLDHVNEDDGDHEVRAPAVQGANEPAERDLAIEGLQAVPGLAGRGHIDEGEKDAGRDLDREGRQRRAAEHIGPTRGIPRSGMRHRFPNGRAKLEPRVDPTRDRVDQAHGGPSFDRFAERPGVGISPALIRRFPRSTRVAYSNRPRSGGPEARAPSA